MKPFLFILDKNQRKSAYWSGILWIIFGIIILISHIISEKPKHDLNSLFYFLQGLVFLFFGYSRYTETTVRIKENSLIIKWTNSLKKRKFKEQNISDIDISRIFLSIQTNDGKSIKYSLKSFENEKRKELLNYLRESFGNKLTVNSLQTK